LTSFFAFSCRRLCPWYPRRCSRRPQRRLWVAFLRVPVDVHAVWVAGAARRQGAHGSRGRRRARAVYAGVASRSRVGRAVWRLIREVIPSLANTLRRCHSTVRGLRNRRAPISGLDSPSRASRAICSSWGGSASRSRLAARGSDDSAARDHGCLGLPGGDQDDVLLLARCIGDRDRRDRVLLLAGG
jgi:hypothetical protein